MAEIQWFPGHMAQALRRLVKEMQLIDLVVEVVDARVPRAGRNAHLATLVEGKPRVIALTREDLADPHATAAWLAFFEAQGQPAIALDGKTRGTFLRLRTVLEAIRNQHNARKSERVVVIGIPNAGKSTVINGLVGKNVARIEDRAGVTRASQWFAISPTLELLDTAGILAPKIASHEAQWMLALTGALPRARYDPEDVIGQLRSWLLTRPNPATRIPDLLSFARTRGFLRRGYAAHQSRHHQYSKCSAAGRAGAQSSQAGTGSGGDCAVQHRRGRPHGGGTGGEGGHPTGQKQTSREISPDTPHPSVHKPSGQLRYRNG